eukprot:3779270-Rhodomonas_salina.1
MDDLLGGSHDSEGSGTGCRDSRLDAAATFRGSSFHRQLESQKSLRSGSLQCNLGLHAVQRQSVVQASAPLRLTLQRIRGALPLSLARLLSLFPCTCCLELQCFHPQSPCAAHLPSSGASTHTPMPLMLRAQTHPPARPSGGFGGTTTTARVGDEKTKGPGQGIRASTRQSLGSTPRVTAGPGTPVRRRSKGLSLRQ